MAAFDQLAAVNLILRKIGEVPVVSIDEPYPTLAIALPALEEAQITVLSEGYWFNTIYKAVLQPDVNGVVRTPSNCIKFFPEKEENTFTGKLIRDSQSGTEFIHRPVQGRMILNDNFDELPEIARYAIAYAAAADVYLNDVGPDATYEDLARQRMGYAGQLSADHTVSRKQNSQARRRFNYLRTRLRT